MKRGESGSAAFEILQGARSRVVGALQFATVTRLLTLGTAAIAGGQAEVIDLSGVTGSDSAGLALLIEWLSIAKESGRKLKYENIPAQLEQLAHLSEVDGFLAADAASATASVA